MGLLITFSVSYIITAAFYYVWYMYRHNLEKKDYIKKILYFSLSVSFLVTAMYYFMKELDVLFVAFAYLGVVLVTDNIMIHTYFPKGSLNLKKIDYFLPGAFNTAVIFTILYFALFL